MHAGFLRVIYSRLNASVILERNETRLEGNETRLERNETRLARNETRGGNLHLSGTVAIKASSETCKSFMRLAFTMYIKINIVQGREREWFTQVERNETLYYYVYFRPKWPYLILAVLPPSHA